MDIVTVLQGTMSADNTVRIQAEIEFNSRAQADPDVFLYSLEQVALDATGTASTLRLAALLDLKRYIPKYWSPAFDNYIGNKTVNQGLKQEIRSSLFTLLGDPSSKIRGASAYNIVQIAAVDYPDEWPTLMDTLYQVISSKGSTNYMVLGSLNTMQQLFDDLVTDDQFFQGGVAVEVMKACESLLSDDSKEPEIKVATLPLVKSIIEMLEDVAYYDDEQRHNFVGVVVPRVLLLLSRLSLNVSHDERFVSSILLWDLKGKIYECLTTLLDLFSRFFKGQETELAQVVLEDLAKQQRPYTGIFCSFHNNDPDSVIAEGFTDLDRFKDFQTEASASARDVLINTLRAELKFLMELLELQSWNDKAKMEAFMDIVVPINYLTGDKLEEYADFNVFVTDETDLSTEVDVRGAVMDFFTELNEKDNYWAIDVMIKRLSEGMQRCDRAEARELGSLCAILTASFNNEAESDPSFGLTEFLQFLMAFLDQGFTHVTDQGILPECQGLPARFELLLPKFLLKYSEKLRQYALPSLKQVLGYHERLGGKDEYQLLKSAMLISFQYFNQILPAAEFTSEIQYKLTELVDQLKDDSDEDTNIMMLEVLIILVNIDNKALANSADFFQLVISIGYKDCSNFSLNTPTLECVSELIKNLDTDTYMTLSSKVLFPLINIINGFNGEFSAEVDLTLQVLSEYIKGPVEDFQLPHDLFLYVFPPVCHFILRCDDDNLLQSASTTFNEIVQRSASEVEAYTDPETSVSGNELLLQIVSKFLSPGVSDRAIVNLGSLVVLIIDNFGNSDLIKQYFVDMLRGVTIRLMSSKEVPTIENLILIFNKLMVTNPSETLNFLKNFQVDDSTALTKILPIWFQAFEVMRGYYKILDNIKAFAQLLLLNDPSLSAITVNGDALPSQVPEGVIVTRSMSKHMKIKYEQIAADSKVIKLLVHELRLQIQSEMQDQNDAIAGAAGVIAKARKKDVLDDGDDDWEDVDDGGAATFNELQSYAINNSKVQARAHTDIRDYLIGFFKECFAGKVERFQTIYTHDLNDEDRKVLSETLVV